MRACNAGSRDTILFARSRISLQGRLSQWNAYNNSLSDIR